MTSPTECSAILSLFPLQTVLFPGNKLPLRIFEPRYVDLIGRCMREQQGFGIVGIESGQEAGTIPEIFSVGTEVGIIDFDQGADGFLNILVEGRQRFRIESSRVREDNLLTAIVTPLAPVESTEPAINYPNLAEAFRQLEDHPELKDRISSTSEPITMAYELLPWLPLANAFKVELLGEDDGTTVLAKLEDYLTKMSHGTD
ncbi:MAG: LON peptidase substrate-binding domain-containing protein [Gammaproteobacteria bacterium]